MTIGSAAKAAEASDKTTPIAALLRKNSRLDFVNIIPPIFLIQGIISKSICL
jgi:hypothetical protein